MFAIKLKCNSKYYANYTLDDVSLMNYIVRISPNTKGLLVATFSTFLLTTGCGTAPKKVTSQVPSKPIVTSKVVPAQLSEPLSLYLFETTKVAKADRISAEAWMTIAKSNYESKNYARALRAATEALSMDDQFVEARQIAMLSAVKVTEKNIASYHDNTLMNDEDKNRLKNTLTSMTTLVNTTED